jgi:hypothetical protein
MVSTLDDFHAFGRMLSSGGRRPDGSKLLSAAAVEAMTTDHIGVDLGRSGPSPDRSQVGDSASASRCGLPVWRRASAVTAGPAASAARGRTTRGRIVVGVVLTTDAFTGPNPAPR